MRYSYLDHLECGRCHAEFNADGLQGVCGSCGSPLLAQYDLDGVRNECSPSQIARRSPDLWRYHELLPVRSPDLRVSLGEGMTPLVEMKGTGVALGLQNLLMKDEGLLPTGTFKARGAAVGVSRAKELGVQRVAMPTNGNAGAAWASYAARAGMRALIVMPLDAPSVTRSECVVAGAEVFLVDGLISDAGRLVSEAVSTQGYTDVSTLREPYRLEGKKTMGLELFEQLGWCVPDVILCPTGGGVGIIGIYKALRECQAVGWLGTKVPRLVSVQASGCAPIARAWEQGAMESIAWEDAATIAFGITVPKPLGDFLILEAIYDTGGCAVAIDDKDLLEAQATVARRDGAFICPEGAACFAAAKQLRESGWISDTDEVVVINTGMGIKYPNTVASQVKLLRSGDSIPGV